MAKRFHVRAMRGRFTRTFPRPDDLADALNLEWSRLRRMARAPRQQL